MFMAHANGSFVWSIHMSSIYTYVKCTFTPHPNSKYFIFRCTKLGVHVHLSYCLDYDSLDAFKVTPFNLLI